MNFCRRGAVSDSVCASKRDRVHVQLMILYGQNASASCLHVRGLLRSSIHTIACDACACVSMLHMVMSHS